MQFFLDSAKIDEIAYALDAFDIDGVTTNPRHVLAAGKPFLATIQEIAKLVEGTDKTVSVEVDPHIMDTKQMVAEAERLAATWLRPASSASSRPGRNSSSPASPRRASRWPASTSSATAT